jgi:hypothetical protein
MPVPDFYKKGDLFFDAALSHRERVARSAG